MTVTAAQTGLKLTSKIKILERIWCPESRQKKGPRPVRRLGRYIHPQVAVFCGDVGGGAIYLLLWSLSMCLQCMCGMHTCSCQGTCVETGEQFSGVTFLFHLACIVVYTPGSLAREYQPSPCFCFLSLREKAGITDVCQS